MTKTQKPLKKMTAGELLDRTFEPRGWLIDGLLKEREIALIHAGTGIGKSWFALSLGCMVAGGGSGLYEYSNDKPRKVMVIDGEMDLEDIQERVRICAQAVNADMKTLRENMTIVSRQDQAIGTKFVNLDEDKWQTPIVNTLKNHKFDLVILDNLSTLLKVEDENSASSLDGLTDFLLELKKAGVGALVVHHSNKAGSGYRGSSKIGVTFNLILNLKKPEGAPLTGACFEVTFEKMRSNAPREPFKLTLVEKPAGKRGASYHWEAQEGEEIAHIIWGALKTGNFVSDVELGKHFKKDKSTIGRWLADCIRLGICTKEDILNAKKRAKDYRNSNAGGYDLDSGDDDAGVMGTSGGGQRKPEF